MSGIPLQDYLPGAIMLCLVLHLPGNLSRYTCQMMVIPDQGSPATYSPPGVHARHLLIGADEALFHTLPSSPGCRLGGQSCQVLHLPCIPLQVYTPSDHSTSDVVRCEILSPRQWMKGVTLNQTPLTSPGSCSPSSTWPRCSTPLYTNQGTTNPPPTRNCK